MHAGNGVHPVGEFAVELGGASLAVAVTGRIDAKHQKPICRKAGVGVFQIAQRAHKQPRADQQQQRKRDLRADQGFPQTDRAASDHCGGLVFERGGEIGTRRLQGRQTRPNRMPAKSDTARSKVRIRQSGVAESARGVVPSGMKLMSAWVIAVARSKPASPPPTESKRLSTSNWRTIRERLAPIDRRIAISFLPGPGSRDQKTGEIGACDQKHRAHHAHQHDQRLLKLFPQE